MRLRRRSQQKASKRRRKQNDRKVLLLAALIIGVFRITPSRRIWNELSTQPQTKSTSPEAKESTRFDDIWPQLQDYLCPNLAPKATEVGYLLFYMAGKQVHLIESSLSRHTPLSSKFYNGEFVSNPPHYKIPNSTKHHTFTYVPIWKCANNQIREYLDATFQQTRGMDRIRDVCMFTVIRDPISHFISAYNEVEYRWIEEKEKKNAWFHVSNRLSYLEQPIGSKERFQTFVKNLLTPQISGRFGHWQYDHIFSMSRVLVVTKQYGKRLTAYVPTISNLTYSLPTFLGKHCPGVPESLSSKPMPLLGQHESSSDPLGMYNASQQVWMDQGPVARALCILHVMDYACWRDLPDGIPKFCQEVYMEHDFYESLLNATYREERWPNAPNPRKVFSKRKKPKKKTMNQVLPPKPKQNSIPAFLPAVRSKEAVMTKGHNIGGPKSKTLSHAEFNAKKEREMEQMRLQNEKRLASLPKIKRASTAP